jgi:hypothetical protein
LHTWHHISWFLFLFSLCEVLELLVIFTVIRSSLKTYFVWKTYCIFGIEGFTDLCLKRGQTFIHLILSSLLEYDVSMDEVLELVVVIQTSPISLKTESVCSSYRCFRIAFSSMPDYPAQPLKFG